MNIFVHSEDILPVLQKELSETAEDLIVISAFVKLDALKLLDAHLLTEPKSKRLLVRFRLDDITNKSTDFSIVEYCFENGWEIFFNLDLHSKILLFDSKRFLLGSANVTLSGLGLSKNPNIESMVLGVIDREQVVRINEFFLESKQIDKNLFELMKEDLESMKITNYSRDVKWNKFILDSFNDIIEVQSIWTSEMLFSKSPYDLYSKDCSLLGVSSRESGDIAIIKSKFKELKVFRWLSKSVDNEIYFGELTKKLHSALIDDPSPYRKEVKELLSNLINWIKELEIEEFVIDKPNYSTRIRKIKDRYRH